jgi:2TM domain
MEQYDDIKYQEAAKRVQKIKGFYTHAVVYLVINTAIIISQIQFSSSDNWNCVNFLLPFSGVSV